jgi:tetratricopeptide (TPR) repeat protein
MTNQSLFGRKSPQPQDPQVAATWLRHFQRLARSGQTPAITSYVALMYETSPQPFVPSLLELHDFLSQSLLDLGDFSDAIHEVDFALQMAPDFPPFIHRKGMTILNQARAMQPDPSKPPQEAQSILVAEKVRRINDAVMLLKTYFAKVPIAQKNYDLASLEARIHRELWDLQHLDGDLKQARDAYKNAWDANPQEYFPAINYAETYLLYGVRKGATVAACIQELGDTFNKIVTCCDTHRLQGATTFWIDFTIGQMHLMQDNFRKAKDTYKAGLACTPTPTLQQWESAMLSVNRLHTYIPLLVTADMVSEISALIDTRTGDL